MTETTPRPTPMVRTRTCRKCGTEFSGRYCKTCAKAYRLANRDKIKAYLATWRSMNTAKLKKYFASLYQTEKEKRKATARRWKDKNPDAAKAAVKRWNALNRERKRAHGRKWDALHPEDKRIQVRNRRARIKGNGGVLSKDIVQKLLDLQRGRCACGCAQSLGDDYHLDHRMPLALGGTNTDDNVQLLRKRCNHEKCAKHPIDFMQSRGFLL